MRIRFTLGTLVLVVLLIASTAAFWWNLEQWRPVATFIEKSGTNPHCGFASDESLFYIKSSIPGPKEYAIHISVYNSVTGSLKCLLETSLGAPIQNQVTMTSDSKYLLLVTQEILERNFSLNKIWDLKTGNEVPEMEYSQIDGRSPFFIFGSSHVLTVDRSNQHWTLNQFPSMNVLHQYQRRMLMDVDNTNGSFCFSSETGVEIYNPDGSLRKSFETARDTSVKLFAKCGKVLLYDLNKATFVDIDSGQKLFDLTAKGGRADTIFFELGFPLSGTHVLYFTPFGSCHAYDVAKDKDQVLPHGFKASRNFLIDGDYVYNEFQSLNTETNQIGCQISGRYFGGGRIRIQRTDDRIATLDMRNGESLGSIARFRWPHEFGSEIALVFPRERAFVTRIENRFTLWRQVMPDRVTGALCMPEFWVTVVLAGLLVWHLIRERRERVRTVHAG